MSGNPFSSRAPASAVQAMYRVKIKETLRRPITDFTPGLHMETLENGETLMQGAFIDQAALRGFLNQLWDRNCTVLLVEQFEAVMGEQT